ncbi:unnamed protein product [Cunninghamella echinulata]
MTESKWSFKTLVNILVVNFGLFYQSTCVVFAQYLSLPFYYFNWSLYVQYIAYTMRIWSQSLIAVVQYFAPADLVLTFDKSCINNNNSIQNSTTTTTTKTETPAAADKLFELNNQGVLKKLFLPKRIIVTANHQIYADWVYIWCISQLANQHGSLKIILKDSLKNLPIYGLGMQFFDFIFLKRKLADDEKTIINNLGRSKKDGTPLWLVLFPEGTVISNGTRKRSKDFAEKNNLKDNIYTLLPRSTGLRLCIQSLGESVEWMYDFTIGYPGIKPGENPEDIYTIPKIFFFDQQPRKIHVYIRRFRIKGIPVDDETEFSKWVYQRWQEKDSLMAHFYKEGRFPNQHEEEEKEKEKEKEKDNDDRKSLSANDQQSILTKEVSIKLFNPIRKLAQPTLCLLPYLPIIFSIYSLGRYLYSYLF